MLRRIGIIAVLSLIVAALAAVPAWAAIDVDIFPANAPSGTHLQSGDIECSVDNNTVTCSSFELAGVGNFDARAVLRASYSATVTCTNKGGKTVDVKTQTPQATADSALAESKNGRLTVPELESTRPSNSTFTNLAVCPNPNWTKAVVPGSVELESFTYTVTFGHIRGNNFDPAFDGPYIRITGP
jgi:hypothetical protein